MAKPALTIKKTELQSLVALAGSASRKRVVIDWHSRALLCVEDGVLSVAGGSEDGVAVGRYDAEGSPDFRVAVRLVDLQSMLANSRAKMLDLTLRKSHIRFYGDGDDFSLAFCGTAPEEPSGWPSLPRLPKQQAFSCNAGELKRAVSFASPAMDDVSISNNTLDVLHFDPVGEQLDVSATDGRIFASCRIGCDTQQEGQLRVSECSLRILRSFLTHAPADHAVSVAPCDGGIVCWHDSAFVRLCSPASRPLSMNPFWSIFERQSVASFDIPSAELSRMLKGSIVGYGKDESSQVLLMVRQGELRIASKPGHAHDLWSSASCGATAKDPVVAIFDARHILRLLSGVDHARASLVEQRGKGSVGYCLRLEPTDGVCGLVNGATITDAAEKRGRSVLGR